MTTRVPVADLDAAAECARATELGATLIAPVAATPNGHRAVVRHPDRGVFEYVGP